ncbi:hypothetical protein [Nonomuraea recticatena]|uniref:Uncharacterized protein n=1 Tax=Nonomuraea recticatena TaxID=46178 RepID=A0ABN3SVT3_9ACTN
MEPNSREVRKCNLCHRRIFFALTKNGQWQALDAEAEPALGSVAAYRRGIRLWWCRSLLAADADEYPPHPLERRFTPHAQTCPGWKPQQQEITGIVVESSPRALPQRQQAAIEGRPSNVVPLQRRRSGSAT